MNFLNTTTVFICAIIGLIFIICIISLLCRLIPAKKQLKHFNINDKNNEEIKVFSLYNQYQNFLHSKIKSDIYAEEIINLESITKAYKINLRVYNIIPNILTNLGILGTFIGLSIAVTQFDSGTSDSIRNSISILLDGMGTAFITSLCGMGTAILYLIFEKWWLNSFQFRIDDICSDINNKHFTPTSEMIIDSLSYNTEGGYKVFPSELFRKIKDNVDEMNTTIKNFGTDLYDNIGNAMDNSFQKRLVPITNELSKKLENPAQAVTDSLISELKVLINAFTENLTSELTNRMDDLLERFIDASNAINILPDTLDKTINKLISLLETIEDQSSKMRKGMDHFNISLNSMTESVNEINLLHNKLTTITDKMEHISDDVSNVSEEMENASVNVRTSFELINANVEDHLSNIGTIQDGLKDIFAEISEGLVQYSETTRKGLEHILNPFTEALTNATEKVANAIAPLSDTVDGLDDIIREAPDKFQLLTKTIREFNNLQTPLIDATERVANAIAPLSDTIDGLEDIIKEAPDKFQSLTKIIRELNKLQAYHSIAKKLK